jgi:hypothetical protein
MPENPFPGMNPYLESRWGDVHAALVTYARDLIQDSLPSDLRARMQERVFIEQDGIDQRAVYPDVYVYEKAGQPAASGAPATAVVAEPLVVRLPHVEVREAYLEIVDARSSGRVVTLIEFVSRSNKSPGPGRELYEQKQAEARDAGVNLVEVDLLRGGKPVTLATPGLIPSDRRAPYHVSVWRATRRGQLEYYGAPLRRALPRVSVPLRAGDADVGLDLQVLVNLAYRRGRYDDIDYTLPPEPPFEGDDAAWVQSLLHEGKRPE